MSVKEIQIQNPVADNSHKKGKRFSGSNLTDVSVLCNCECSAVEGVEWGEGHFFLRLQPEWRRSSSFILSIFSK